MDRIICSQAFTKSLLRALLKMKSTTFKSWMKTVEPEILKIDPYYSRLSSILTPKVARFLLAEYGFEDAAEVNEMIREYLHGNKQNEN